MKENTNVEANELFVVTERVTTKLYVTKSTKKHKVVFRGTLASHEMAARGDKSVAGN